METRGRNSGNSGTETRGQTGRFLHDQCAPSGPAAVPLRCGCQAGAELACGEIFQGAEAYVEFGGRQAPLAVERAQKIRRRTVTLARVAFDTAGNQVAVGIA